MNVFIFAVCLNLLTLVNADDDINLDTIFKLLKGRRSSNTKFNETNYRVEAIPIIPGFYLQKPKDISKSLFKNPTSWPNSVYGIFDNEDTRTNKTKLQDLSNLSKEDHLKAKILKAVKNLNKYRESQKHKNDKKEKPRPYIDSNSAQKVSIEKLLDQKVANGNTNINNYLESDKYLVESTSNTDKKAEKLLVEKLLSQILREIKSNNRYEESLKYKKQPNWDSGSRNAQKLEKLLKNILNGNLNNNNYRIIESFADDTTEERSENTDKVNKDLLENILNAHRFYNHQDQGRRHPSLIISKIRAPKITRSRLLSRNIQEFLYGRPHSSAFHNNEYQYDIRRKEKNNNESVEVFDEDYDTSDAEVRYGNRRTGTTVQRKYEEDDLSTKDASDDTDLEKNPGNPFTIHKNKYKQNWPSNHFMDGNHMNINPFGPQFGSLGPSGPELFFGRKWWYYNQDDYKPMG